MNKSKYQELKAKKICVYCYKKPAVEGKVGCAECNEKMRIRSKETREWFKSIGYCPVCGRNKLFGTERRCPECNAKAYATNIKSKERRKITNQILYKRDKERLERENLCCRCRKKERSEGHIYCVNCLIIKREQGRKYREKKHGGNITRSERPNYGLCYTCGSPIESGQRICEKCKEQRRKNLPKKTDNSKHIWREMDQLIKKQGV